MKHGSDRSSLEIRVDPWLINSRNTASASRYRTPKSLICRPITDNQNAPSAHFSLTSRCEVVLIGAHLLSYPANRHLLRRSVRSCIASVLSIFFGLWTGSAFAGTAKDFFQNTDLKSSTNYTPAGVPTNTTDVRLTTTGTALTVTDGTLTIESLTATNGKAYQITNNVAANNKTVLSTSVIAVALLMYLAATKMT